MNTTLTGILLWVSIFLITSGTNRVDKNMEQLEKKFVYTHDNGLFRKSKFYYPNQKRCKHGWKAAYKYYTHVGLKVHIAKMVEDRVIKFVHFQHANISKVALIYCLVIVQNHNLGWSRLDSRGRLQTSKYEFYLSSKDENGNRYLLGPECKPEATATNLSILDKGLKSPAKTDHELTPVETTRLIIKKIVKYQKHRKKRPARKEVVMQPLRTYDE